MEDVTVSTWHDLQDLLFRGAWNAELGRFRSNYAFRGLPRAKDGLLNAFCRTYGNQPHVELGLLRNFRKYAPSGTPAGLNYWDWLSLAQHHGLPMRLLDWTYSPFVALHFVTADTDLACEDGVVWCVDFVEAHKLLPPLLRRVLDRESSNVFTTEMLGMNVPDLYSLDQLGASEPFLLFLEPPSLDERIVNQYALFSLLPSPTLSLDYWIEAHPELCRKIIVQADLKWEVRDKLDQGNITERVLFPGLDGLCAWLRRHYLPKPPA